MHHLLTEKDTPVEAFGDRHPVEYHGTLGEIVLSDGFRHRGIKTSPIGWRPVISYWDALSTDIAADAGIIAPGDIPGSQPFSAQRAFIPLPGFLLLPANGFADIHLVVVVGYVLFVHGFPRLDPGFIKAKDAALSCADAVT